MPLPLIMGLGLGIVGGAKYLMGKEDDKQAKSLLDTAASELYNSPLGQSGMADPYIANIRSIAQQDTGILGMMMGEPNKSQRIQGLMDQALMANRQHMQNQWSSQEAQMGRAHDFSLLGQRDLVDQQNDAREAGYQQQNTMLGANLRNQSAMYAHNLRMLEGQQAGQVANQRDMVDRTFQLSDQLDQDVSRDMGEMAVYQDNYRKGLSALASNNPADVVASMYNFFQMVEPGGMVRDAESGQYKGVGGASSQFANLLNEVQGKGLNDKTRRQLQEAMGNQYGVVFDRFKRVNDTYGQQINQMRNAGYNVMDPRERLGIDWTYGVQQPKGRKNEKGQTPAEAAAEKQGLVIQK